MNPITRFETAAGRCIYSLPVRTFPGLVTNIFVISDGQRRILVDCGSGQEQSNQELVAGLAAIGEQFGEPVSLGAIDQILITHGHIDHYGGLPFVRQFSQAPIGVHVLDRRVLSNHEERIVVASRRLEVFLERAGVSATLRAKLMAMYQYSKQIYRSTPVQFLLDEGPATDLDLVIYHTPGHCPGQVCIQVDDILLTADHVLSRTTPHQAPESITLNMGLGHYLASLSKIEVLPGIRLGLGNHEAPMPDLPGRIRAIKAAHDERLDRVLAICREPRTIAEVSQALFGPAQSYHILLALEEAGAHVEYLYQRGELVAANLDEIAAASRAVIRYIRA